MTVLTAAMQLHKLHPIDAETVTANDPDIVRWDADFLRICKSSAVYTYLHISTDFDYGSLP